ncbi:DUF1127 domain-containing protein [Yoonia sp. MH D7]
MATTTNTRSNTAFLSGTIKYFAKSVVAAFAAWNDERVTHKSLSKLSARELDDIGLSYCDIEGIAKRLAR